MTTEKLQDAISLLPTDLVAATDRLRTAPQTRIIRWQRWAAMAACLVLLLGTGLMLRQMKLPDRGVKTEVALEAPMAMAPALQENHSITEEAAAEAAMPEPPSDIGAPEVLQGDSAGSEIGVDHSHRYAEPAEKSEIPSGYSGNLVTRVTVDGQVYDLYGGDSAAITDILQNLSYDPAAVCRCMAEFTVDTEEISGIQVNLSEAFARCTLGQAALTEEQTVILRDILNNLQ